MNLLIMKLAHPAATIAAQFGVFLATGNAVWGGVAAATGFAFREVTQAEYRYIEAFGKQFKTREEYAKWHYMNYGKKEGRLPRANWTEYWFVNEDIQPEFDRLSGTRHNVPWYCGFNPKVWTTHSVLGVALPAAVVPVVAILLGASQ